MNTVRRAVRRAVRRHELSNFFIEIIHMRAKN